MKNLLLASTFLLSSHAFAVNFDACRDEMRRFNAYSHRTHFNLIKWKKENTAVGWGAGAYAMTVDFTKPETDEDNRSMGKVLLACWDPNLNFIYVSEHPNTLPTKLCYFNVGSSITMNCGLPSKFGSKDNPYAPFEFQEYEPWTRN